MYELEKKNLVDLGNFGFLLRNDRSEDKEIKLFLYELASLAEGNIYTNARMSGVYIRQLAEAFLGYMVVTYGLILESDDENSGYGYSLARYQKILHGKSGQTCIPPKGYPKVSDIVPWDFVAFNTTIPIQQDMKTNLLNNLSTRKQSAGDSYSNQKRIDYLKKNNRYYAWDYVREIGNSASHTKQSEANKAWLRPECLIEALIFIREKLHRFFVSSYAKNEKLMAYNRYSMAINSRQLFYPQNKTDKRDIPKVDSMPAFTERLYNGIVPMEDKANGVWYYKNNKYYLLRRYEIPDDSDAAGFLMHSQEAYLKLQKDAIVECVAPYNVLADTKNNSGYYISIYEFPTIPLDFNYENLRKLQIYRSFERIKRLFIELVSDFEQMNVAGVYLRNFTHDSLRLCEIRKGSTQSFKAYIINFEMSKISDGTVTTYRALNISNSNNANHKNSQYHQIEWKPDMRSDEYFYFEAVRLGEVFANILCPTHLSGVGFEKAADKEEILSENNIIANEPVMDNKEQINKLLGIIESLRTEDFDSYSEIKKRLVNL